MSLERRRLILKVQLNSGIVPTELLPKFAHPRMDHCIHESWREGQSETIVEDIENIVRSYIEKGTLLGRHGVLNTFPTLFKRKIIDQTKTIVNRRKRSDVELSQCDNIRLRRRPSVEAWFHTSQTQTKHFSSSLLKYASEAMRLRTCA
ncbi:hypothetical protein Fmac_011399 [Flemingia macrophylla]|uniref:Uncharacterized protein n=1 Tax=Flemingia macrophylla TaxID=520843 RepID=A0ABD1MMB5_9FABA